MKLNTFFTDEIWPFLVSLQFITRGKGEFVKRNQKGNRDLQIKFFQDSQLWKLDGTLLENKEGSWTSDDDWNFLPQSPKIVSNCQHWYMNSDG